GDQCLIMAYCHVAHNCEVGNKVIMSNNATLAGHVIVEDFAIISGFTPIHTIPKMSFGRFMTRPGITHCAQNITLLPSQIYLTRYESKITTKSMPSVDSIELYSVEPN
ncbi:MAG: hypothetical protein ACMG55_09705, partial [Microcoleus sp.]